MRVAALAEVLSRGEAAEAVALLAGLFEHATRTAGRDPAPASVLLEGRSLAERLGYERVQRIYREARASGAENVCRLFVTHAPRSHEPAPAQPTSDPLRTLGHRKARARRERPDRIPGLLADPDPDVIASLLENPALTEQDVLKIASRRPAAAETLERLFRHPRWSRRYRVRKALAYNPYTPVNAAVALVPFLNATDLAELARSGQTHTWVRERAREVLTSRRRGRGGASKT